MQLRRVVAAVLSLAWALLACACSDMTDGSAADGGIVADGDAGFAGDDLLVSGMLVREMLPTTWNEPFVPDAAAHVEIELIYVEAADASSEQLVVVALPIAALPFAFELRGNAAAAFARRGEYAVDAVVYNHAGDEVRVGDMVSEYFESVDGVTMDREIRVSGLEHCDAPNAGGFCTSNE